MLLVCNHYPRPSHIIVSPRQSERGFPATCEDYNCEEEKEGALCYELDMFCSIKAGKSSPDGNPLHIALLHGMFFEDCTNDFLLTDDEKICAVNRQFMTQVHSSWNMDLLYAVIEQGCLCRQSAPHPIKPEIECNELLIHAALSNNLP